MNCLTPALKNMNVIDGTKEWFASISALKTTDNVSKWKHDYYRHSIFITESLNF